MFTMLLILVGVYIVYRLVRSLGYSSSPYNSGGFDKAGMGGMFGGMILGYLLSNYLIDQNQYNMWQNLTDEELRDTLTSKGILNNTDYDGLAEQATMGTLPGYESDDNSIGWNNDNDNYDYTDYNDDGGGGDDFGGFDS
jgi:hypothetical protein